MKLIKTLFFSSSEISLELLKALSADNRFRILGLVCKPDKEAGRNLNVKEGVLKQFALCNKIPVFQPDNLETESIFENFKKLGADIFLTFAYGKILSEKYLSLPKLFPINIHASILPKYRGASPIQSAILNGESETGISIMKMEKKMDTGPVFSIIKIKIEPNHTALDLFKLIAKDSAVLLPDLLATLNDKTVFNPQEDSNASYCSKLEKNDGFLNFNHSTEQILRMFRAYYPWPSIWTNYMGKRLKLLEIQGSTYKLQSGVVSFTDGNLYIGTSDASIRVIKLQVESKQAVSADAFINGHPNFVGTVLPS